MPVLVSLGFIDCEMILKEFLYFSVYYPLGRRVSFDPGAEIQQYFVKVY